MDATKLVDDEPGTVPFETLEFEDEFPEPSHDEIADLAYSYYEQRGFRGGSPLEDWLRAEQELKRSADSRFAK